jgi:hypothetical protein
MNKNDTEWFRPLWLRVGVTAVVAVWCAIEWLVWKEQLWSLLTTAALAYCIWSFFISFPKDGGADGQPKA